MFLYGVITCRQEVSTHLARSSLSEDQKCYQYLGQRLKTTIVLKPIAIGSARSMDQNMSGRENGQLLLTDQLNSIDLKGFLRFD